MKTCPKCGYVIENDNAKFCKKCGTKLPEFVAEQHKNTTIIPLPNDGVLLREIPERNITSNIETTSPSYVETEKPISSSFANPPVVKAKKKGLVWAVKTCFSKYATFKGRATRSEYWFFYLFNAIMSSILMGLALMLEQEEVGFIFFGLTVVYLVVTFLPSLSVTVRRLHDIGKSGWWYFMVLVPYIGALILLYYLCKKGTKGKNVFG